MSDQDELFQLSIILAEMRDTISLASTLLPNEKERRRYALLQAAAGITKSMAIGFIPDSDVYRQAVRMAAELAESLLAEIEKREAES